MSWIGCVVFSASALAAFAGAEQAPPYCDAELLRAPKSPTSYQVRGDRCEGVYAQQVSTVSVDLRSFVSGFGSFDPERDLSLELAWQAPPGIVGDTRLRAYSVKSRTYFRMDTAQPAATGSYLWPTDVLAGERLGAEDLGVLAWFDKAGPNGQLREIYLPLRVGTGKPGADAYEVTIVPSARLETVRLDLSQIDERGTVLGKVFENRDPGGEFAHYPSNEPTAVSIGEIGAAGFYRLEIKFKAARGDGGSKEIDFYHSGDGEEVRP